jgi:hypothetical protein
MEFLVRVEPHAEGGYEATCRPVKTEPIGDWFALDMTACSPRVAG